MNKRYGQHEPSMTVHPVVHRLLLAPSGATRIRGGPLDESCNVDRAVSLHVAADLVPINDKGTEFVLFDTGADIYARNIQRRLRSINANLTLAAVKAIFITHGHLDHVAGTAAFPETVVCVSEDDREYIEGKMRAESPIGAILGRLPKKARRSQNLETVRDQQIVSVGNGHFVTAHAVPGHTTGSMAYTIGNVIFPGDAMIFNKYGGVSLSPRLLSRDTKVAKRSLMGLVDRLDDSIRIVAPSHSDAGSIDVVRQWCEDQRKAT